MTPIGVTGNERVKLNPGLETRILGLYTRYSAISDTPHDMAKQCIPPTLIDLWLRCEEDRFVRQSARLTYHSIFTMRRWLRIYKAC